MPALRPGQDDGHGNDVNRWMTTADLQDEGKGTVRVPRFVQPK